MTTPFASIDDLELLVGHDVDPRRAELLLRLTTDAIVNVAQVGGASLRPVDQASVQIVGTGGPTVLLPRWPIREIDTVSIAGRALDPSAYGWTRAGALRYNRGSWSIGPIDVVYSYGYAELPPGIEAATLQIAARVLVNPQRLNSFSAGGGGDTAGFGGGGAGVQVLELYQSEVAMVRRALQ